MRKFLYSRWFFLVLAVSCAMDLLADIARDIWRQRTYLNDVALVLDVIILIMAVWIFTDLQRRRPKNGGNPRRG